MRKQPKKKNQNIHQIFGLNGALNILEYKKKKIMRVDIMQDGVAERKPVIIKLIKTKSQKICFGSRKSVFWVPYAILCSFQWGYCVVEPWRVGREKT